MHSEFRRRAAICAAIASWTMGLVIVFPAGVALADSCASGMTMGQYGVCVPATNGESSSVAPEWRQASGGEAVNPDSPTSICQTAPPCPEGEALILSDCECPPR